MIYHVRTEMRQILEVSDKELEIWFHMCLSRTDIKGGGRVFDDDLWITFNIPPKKYRLWVLIKIASPILMSTHNICFIEAILMSMHNICFYGEPEKITQSFFF